MDNKVFCVELNWMVSIGKYPPTLLKKKKLLLETSQNVNNKTKQKTLPDIGDWQNKITVKDIGECQGKTGIDALSQTSVSVTTKTLPETSASVKMKQLQMQTVRWEDQNRSTMEVAKQHSWSYQQQSHNTPFTRLRRQAVQQASPAYSGNCFLSSECTEPVWLGLPLARFHRVQNRQ